MAPAGDDLNMNGRILPVEPVQIRQQELLVTVSLAPMVRWPICRSRLWDSFSSPVSSRPMALRTYSYSIRPSAVRVTPREFRANSRVCSSASSCLMDWLTAD